MSVRSTHPQYDKHSPKWELVRNVVNSEVRHYIYDVEKDSSDVRNKRYKGDARLTNFTARTKNGLVGAVFRKDAVIELPTSVDYLKEDATGARMKLNKLAQEVTGEVLMAGRYGLLVDYPASDQNLSKAEVARLDLKARICKYKPESIINWHHEVINGRYVLSLVVLKEVGSVLMEDGFTWEEQEQYRVLRLLDGLYVQQLYNKKEELISEYYPTDYSGQNWTEIPFVFVGAEDNDAEIDAAPLYDLAELNIGHLRNSADYEESVHVTGQPTLVLTTSMSIEQFEEFNPDGVVLGARRGINLGESGSAVMLQATPNQLADEAMRRKEEQAIMIGARLVQPVGSNETATAAAIKHSGENSVLSAIVDNVEAALKLCIQWCMMFSEANPTFEDIVFKINKTFYDQVVDAQLVMAQLQLYTNDIIAKSDIRHNLRKTGLIDEARIDDEIDSELSTDVNPLGDNGLGLL